MHPVWPTQQPCRAVPVVQLMEEAAGYAFVSEWAAAAWHPERLVVLLTLDWLSVLPTDPVPEIVHMPAAEEPQLDPVISLYRAVLPAETAEHADEWC